MLFNSVTFGIFLVIALLLFWSAPRGHRVFVLLGLSYFFYMYSYPIYFFLLSTLTVLNFVLVMEMAKHPRYARHLLGLLIFLDLLCMGIFKYTNFAVSSAESVVNIFGMDASFPVFDITLPLGISFFTFQMMSYAIDTYRGGPAEKSFWNFAAYISFFPQLIAGPIVRSHVLLPQLKGKHAYKREQAIRGLFLIAQGLVKKIAFADFLGGYVDAIYAAAPGEYSGLSLVIAAYAYSFQVYFDFSGYTDIAIGCGRLFGFDIPINFNLPYIARSPRDYWRRWHISLSTWLRDYLYIPLGGNRKGEGRTYVNIMITMALGGLWHGATWNRVIWGVYNGVLVIVEHFLEKKFDTVKRFLANDFLPVAAFNVMFTLSLVSFGLIIFRSQSMVQAGEIMRGCFAGGFDVDSSAVPIVLMLAVLMASHIIRNKWDMEDWFVRRSTTFQAFGYACATIVIYLFFTTEQRFIYFQF
jgi:D-alanyl-lipoteichoic acid acyltransferase DltB (MBOAT superfamily)